jgi:hypothetical protein
MMDYVKKVITMCFGVIPAFVGLGYGEENKVTLTPTGYASYEVGQIVKANPQTTQALEFQTEHLLYQKSFVGFNLLASYAPLPITTNIGVELKSFNETPRKSVVAGDNGLAVRFFYFFYLTHADFIYSKSEGFNLDVGYFPIKYDDNARNLGEYLFRSGTYPQYLITNFDFAAARVTGINAFGTLFDNLNYKALLTINTEGATMGDLNLTGIASYSLFNKFLDLGGGVSFCSFLSANSNHTRPPRNEADNKTDWYIDNGDTNTYTFAGTKLMGRLSIDPKALFPSNIFGKEDLKLYAEAAILGVKNYPVSIDTSTLGTRYDDVGKRIPIMFGVNVPTFKFLDVLSLEAEWFGSPYPNDMTTFVVNGIPTSTSSKWGNGNGSFYADSTADNWKWSMYAKKTFAGHFNAVVQVASDHYRWDKFGYQDQANMLSEALTQPRHFYYVAKLGYCF